MRIPLVPTATVALVVGRAANAAMSGGNFGQRMERFGAEILHATNPTRAVAWQQVYGPNIAAAIARRARANPGLNVAGVRVSVA